MQSVAPESLAVRRRRESRREEWTEHMKLAGLLDNYLDPSCTFWTSLENKPLSMLSGIFQKRRGVRGGLPDVLVIARGRPIFVELKSRRGVASKAQETNPHRNAAGGRCVVDGPKRARCDDGAASVRRGVPSQMGAAAAPTMGGTVPRSDSTLAAASEGGCRAAGGKAALSVTASDARERGCAGGGATNCVRLSASTRGDGEFTPCCTPRQRSRPGDQLPSKTKFGP
jgi:hypothetical protein